MHNVTILLLPFFIALTFWKTFGFMQNVYTEKNMLRYSVQCLFRTFFAINMY
jgi:hypothetical protein